MMSNAGRLRKRILGISLNEATFAVRGFRSDDVTIRERLEHIGCVFLQGYHTALEEGSLDALASRLDVVEAEFRGFAYEGAAMGVTLLDLIMPWRKNRLQALLDGPGAKHVYLVHVGVGWILARLHGRFLRPFKRLDPVLRWLAFDGYGFHEGYFNWPRTVGKQEVPKHLQGYSRRAFDQGLGRSLWFVEGTDVSRIPAVISAFCPARQADLWSGIGLACAYAGGVDCAEIQALQIASGDYSPHLAQGAAFAAKARQLAENPTAHTEKACKILCGVDTPMAAQICDTSLEGLKADSDSPAFELWRQRIQARFEKAVAVS